LVLSVFEPTDWIGAIDLRFPHAHTPPCDEPSGFPYLIAIRLAFDLTPMLVFELEATAVKSMPISFDLSTYDVVTQSCDWFYLL